MRQKLDNLVAWHGELESRKRVQLYAAGAITLIAVALTGSWLSFTPYRPLISGRAYDEVLDAAAALQPAEIPYRIEDNGTLSVPATRLGEARAALGSRQGLPALGDVADLRLGLTPKAQDWAFLRAREGDIARMINGIDGVSASRVNITPRVEALFADEEEPARASVFLKQRPGRKVGTAQVEAVVNLVASAVEGLEPQHVSVVNERGQLLSAGSFGTASSANTPEKLLEYQQAQERRYEGAVANALNPLLGYNGGFSVTATVDLEMTEEERLEKAVDTEKQALLSEQLHDSKSEKGEVGGIPGVDANLPERPAPAAGNSGRTETSAVTSNYVYPTVDTKTVRPSGEVRRVSVAVQVDDKIVAGLAEAGGVAVEDVKSRIEQAVKASVGFDEKRLDTVSVTFLPFAEPQWVEGGGAVLPWTEVASDVAPWGVAALALILGFLFVVRPLMAAVTRQEQHDIDEAAWLAEHGGPSSAVDPNAGLVDRLRQAASSFEAVDPGDLNKLAKQQSAAAAHVLRQWHRNAGE
ncbi:MAG: flagellar M-ring protein FliF [Myxococcales bacterium]|nr:flagellar M-ring protein FliF [Myxococcales bacterium]